MNTQERIIQLVQQGLADVSASLRVWVEAHLVTPRPIDLFKDIEPDSPTRVSVWLVTDHTGIDDHTYRIIYVPDKDLFGFEITLIGDRELFLGTVGTFSETVENLD